MAKLPLNGVAETGVKGVSHRLTDEVSITLIALSRHRTYQIHARPALSAGVQTMRARICSAFSCDMFARVVWLKSWEMAKLLTSALLPTPHALATHGSRD